MIAKLYGLVDAIFTDKALIRVQDISFSVFCSRKTLDCFSVNQSVVLWIEHIIRAESQVLCGFLTYDEQLCFREIMSVQSVGVKVALSLLSVFTPQEIISAILVQDKCIFTQADGVGPKVAERIIIELKNSKLIKTFKTSVDLPTTLLSVESDAIEALITLGYDRFHAQKVVLEISKGFSEISTEDLVKLALTQLSLI